MAIVTITPADPADRPKGETLHIDADDLSINLTLVDDMPHALEVMLHRLDARFSLYILELLTHPEDREALANWWIRADGRITRRQLTPIVAEALETVVGLPLDRCGYAIPSWLTPDGEADSSPTPTSPPSAISPAATSTPPSGGGSPRPRRRKASTRG